MRDILADAANKIKRFEEELASKKAQVDAEAQVEYESYRITRCRVAWAREATPAIWIEEE